MVTPNIFMVSINPFVVTKVSCQTSIQRRYFPKKGKFTWQHVAGAGTNKSGVQIAKIIMIMIMMILLMKTLLKALWHATAHVRQLDFCSGEQFFKIGVLVKKSSCIDPETPKKAIISVFKRYLVHLGSFKCHILYFCASVVEKIRSH